MMNSEKKNTIMGGFFLFVFVICLVLLLTGWKEEKGDSRKFYIYELPQPGTNIQANAKTAPATSGNGGKYQFLRDGEIKKGNIAEGADVNITDARDFQMFAENGVNLHVGNFSFSTRKSGKPKVTRSGFGEDSNNPVKGGSTNTRTVNIDSIKIDRY